MAIADKLTDLATDITNAYNTIINKGVTLNILPEEYVELEYIEANGNQYFDTGVNHLLVPFEIDFAYYDTDTGQADHTIFGERMLGFLINLYQERYETIFGNTVQGVRVRNQKLTVKLDSTSGFYINDNLMLAGAKTSDLYTTGSALMFAFRETTGTTTPKYKFIGRLYYYTIKEQGEITHNFVPCYRKSDGVNGMYDTVTRIFHTNQGTGSFTRGSEVEKYHKNTNNLSDAINKIPIGLFPSGNLAITENGDYDVTNYETASVAVLAEQLPIVTGTGEFEVRFIDYDGTHYKTQYVNSGESATPPTLPNHPNLTFSGWSNNYAYVTRDVDTGATYYTTDGLTHIECNFTEESGKNPTLNLYMVTSGTGIINWGDGNTTSIATGTGARAYPHIYTNYGEYDITISHSGTYYLGYGTLSLTKALLGNMQTSKINYALKNIYCSIKCVGFYYYCCSSAKNLEKVSVSSISRLGSYAFSKCINLKGINFKWSGTNTFEARVVESSPIKFFMIPDSITSSSMPIITSVLVDKIILPKTRNSTSIGYGGYQNSAVKKIILPINSTLVQIGYAFAQGTPLLQEFEIPEGYTTIGDNAFSQDYGLLKFVIPSTMQTIGNYVWSGCSGLLDIYCYATTPPTITGANSFGSVPAYCKIHVPAGSLSAYQIATNWSAQASKMVGDL